MRAGLRRVLVALTALTLPHASSAAVLIDAAALTAPRVAPVSVLPTLSAAPLPAPALTAPALTPLSAPMAAPFPAAPFPAAPIAAPAAAPALAAPALAAIAAEAAPADGPRAAPPSSVLDAFWDGTKRDKRAVDAFAELARTRADEHGRVTPELQAALTRIEAAHAPRFTRGARRAWQSMMARLGATTTLPITLPPVKTPYWQKDGGPMDGYLSAERVPETADVVIVGAGLTGASAARRLAEEAQARGLRVVVLDAGDPAGQASGRNGGNFHLIPENYLNDYHGLVAERAEFAKHADPRLSDAQAAELGERQARAILRLSAVNRKRLLAIAREDRLAIDLAPNGGVRVAKTPEEEKALHAEAAFARSLGFDLKALTAREVDDALGLPPGTSPLGGRLSNLDGNYHPYKFVHGALGAAVDLGVQLFTRTPVRALTRDADGNWTAETARGTVRAPKVIMAVNAFTDALVPELKGALKPYRSQVQVTEHAAEKWGGRTVTAEQGDLYGHHPNGARYRDGAGVSRAPLLLGGGKDAPTRKRQAVPRSRKTHDFLTAKRDALYPELKGVPPSAEWGGPMAFTPDRLPAIGELKPGLIVAAGFNGYGGVYTQAAGLAAAEIALSGRAPAWAPQDIFSPKRFLKPGAPALNDRPAALDGPSGPADAAPERPRSSNSFWDGFRSDAWTDSLGAGLEAAGLDEAASEAPWLALKSRDPRLAAALSRAAALARSTAAGRRAFDLAQAALDARGETLPVDVLDLGRNWGEFDYLDGRMRLHRKLFEPGREAELAGTLSHELLHVAQHAAGLPSNALELEIEAHLLDLALMRELGLKPAPNTFAAQAAAALKKSPQAFIELMQAAVPGSPFLGESSLTDILDQMKEERESLLLKRSARAQALAAVIGQDIKSLRSKKGRDAYRAFSKRVLAELSRRSAAGR